MVDKKFCDKCGREIDVKKETWFNMNEVGIVGNELELKSQHELCGDCIVKYK